MATILERPTQKEIIKDQAPTSRRFTVEEYYKMGEVGILQDDERVELIEGRILKLSPKSIRHAVGNDEAGDCFREHLGERVVVRNQNPIHLADDTEPEPDIILAIPPKSRYYDHHPTADEVLLVFEVADSSLKFDRGKKSRTYAKAGIIQYCILNVRDGELEDHRNPSPEGYRSKQTYTAQQSFNLVAFPDVTIAVSELLLPV